MPSDLACDFDRDVIQNTEAPTSEAILVSKWIRTCAVVEQCPL